MESRLLPARNARILIALLMAVLLVPPAHAAENQFEQRIEWHSDGTAYQFRVELEAEEGTLSRSFTTEQNYLDLQLPVGAYRYRVLAYDFLGRLSATSAWRRFEVVKASVPEIAVESSSVQVSEDAGEIVMPVGLDDIAEDSVVELVNERTGEVVQGSIDVSPADGAEDGAEVLSAAQVTFPLVDEGTWRLRVTNPSGLTSEAPGITITQEPAKGKPETGGTETADAADGEDVDAGGSEAEESLSRPGDALRKRTSLVNLQIAAGAGAGFSPYDGTAAAFSTLPFAPALDARLSALPFKSRNLHRRYGLEVSASLSAFVLTNDYFLGILAVPQLLARVVMQQRFLSDKLFLALKAGGGASFMLVGVSYTKDSSGRSGVSDLVGFVSAAAGASLVWMPASHFLIELGADASYIFSKSMPTLLLTPYIDIGLRF